MRRHLPPLPLLLRLLAVGLVAAVFVAPGAGAAEAVAVNSEVFNGYQRTVLPDKSFKPERYTFGEGGAVTRAAKDPGLEEMTFLKVAQAVAGPLGRLNYVPSTKSDETDLLVLVFWGSTQGSRHSDHTDSKNQLTAAISADAVNRAAAKADAEARREPNPSQAEPTDPSGKFALEAALWQMDIANRERDQLDDRNARILGYGESVERARFAAHMSFGQDILGEIGEHRYFVVLQAYDFPTARKHKKLKPLWTIRLSISEAGKPFGEALGSMLASATRYIGRDSKGLRRENVQEGQVEVGPVEVVEIVPGK